MTTRRTLVRWRRRLRRPSLPRLVVASLVLHVGLAVLAVWLVSTPAPPAKPPEPLSAPLVVELLPAEPGRPLVRPETPTPARPAPPPAAASRPAPPRPSAPPAQALPTEPTPPAVARVPEPPATPPPPTAPPTPPAPPPLAPAPPAPPPPAVARAPEPAPAPPALPAPPTPAVARAPEPAPEPAPAPSAPVPFPAAPAAPEAALPAPTQHAPAPPPAVARAAPQPAPPAPPAAAPPPAAPSPAPAPSPVPPSEGSGTGRAPASPPAAGESPLSGRAFSLLRPRLDVPPLPRLPGGGGTRPEGEGAGESGRQREGQVAIPLNKPPDADHADYFLKVKKAIEDHWSYPSDAARRGQSGQLVLEFVIRKDGQVLVELIRSSGIDILDRYAVNAVKLSAPPGEAGRATFPRLPDSLGETLRLSASFTYILDHGFRVFGLK